jgi:NAD(P)-dependent dehydrogenase (short-subunit alcohol dehydrogenase family)
MFGTRDILRQHEILTRAADLIDRGELRTTLTDTLRPINAANLREAHRRLESGTTIGKLVLAGGTHTMPHALRCPIEFSEQPMTTSSRPARWSPARRRMATQSPRSLRARRRVIINGRTQQRSIRRCIRANALGRATSWRRCRRRQRRWNQADRAISDVDILINNAGIFAVQPFFESQDEDWQRFYEVNVLSGVRLSAPLSGGMLSAIAAAVVFISSESGRADSGRDDPLRHDQGRPDRDLRAALLSSLRAQRSTVNFGPAGADTLEGVGTVRTDFRAQAECHAGRIRTRILPDRRGRHPCSSVHRAGRDRARRRIRRKSRLLAIIGAAVRA